MPTNTPEQAAIEAHGTLFAKIALNLDKPKTVKFERCDAGKVLDFFDGKENDLRLSEFIEIARAYGFEPEIKLKSIGGNHDKN